jgi:hypothetical protein
MQPGIVNTYLNHQPEGQYIHRPLGCYSVRNVLVYNYVSLFLLVFVRLVSSFAAVTDGILLHAMDFRLHLGTTSSSEHKKNHVASDHGRNWAEEVHCYAICHLCNRKCHLTASSLMTGIS